MSRSLSRRRFLAGTGGCAAALSGVPTASADGPPRSVTDEAAQPALERVVDDLVETSLSEYDVPGATVAVVTDASDVLTKGYGVADRDEGSPVDPERTPFRVGSVSKPVLATALMDRIRRGDLDPAAGVTEYVDVPVDGAAEEPVTLAQLVTHRGGFEATNRAMWIPDHDRIRSLESYLRTDADRRVREPGSVGSYSNYGYALAGRALAATVGGPFHRAMDEALLTPAGMTRSSFRQPLPPELAAAHATGHGGTGPFSDGSFPLLGLRPAGSMSATAADMSRFLRLHLNDGELDGERVLESGTTEAMHRRWATHHERLDGMAFGLIEERRGDVRTLWHNGGTPSFYSHLVLVPEHDFGLFVAVNDADGRAAATDVVDGVLDEVLPASDDEPLSPDGQPERATELSGTYRSLQRSHTWHDRLTSVLTAGTVDVRVADDGALVTERGGTATRWIEIAPLVFEHEEGGGRIAFGERDGEIAYLFRGGSPTAFGRVEGLDRLGVHAVVAVVTLLGVFSAIGAWPMRPLSDRIGTGDGDGGGIDWRATVRSPADLAMALAVGSAAALLTSLALVVTHFFATPLPVLSDPPVTFRLSFAGTVLGLLGTVAAVLAGIRAAVRGAWTDAGGTGRADAAHFATVAGSLVGLCWLLWYWNLLFPPG